MSISQKAALPLIDEVKKETIAVFPEYREMINSVDVHLVSNTNSLEKRNEIAGTVGAAELNETPCAHAETLIGEKKNAVVVYYQTIANEQEFYHFLIHEFGHVISICANKAIYESVQNDIRNNVETERRAGSSIWSECVAEYIALDIDRQEPAPFTWAATDEMQHLLDLAVGTDSFDPYSLAFYLAMYFNDPTIESYLSRHPGAAIGLDKYDDDLLELMKDVINVIGERFCKEKYWIIDEETLNKLGVCCENFWNYCELRSFSRKLSELVNNNNK